MASTEELLARLVEIAEDQLRWQRAAVLPDVRRTVEQALTTTPLRKAYEMCDGKTQGSDIAKAVGTSAASFSKWTRRWRDLGIAYETESRRIKHLTSLKSLGLTIQLDDERGRQ
jgi:CRP-like cAMP-binding protein